ncbi:homeobox-DDT domain protein RLT1 isoform X1 [Solanum pennellii]|uniref:Homeobox-DDT domain protein RLT1 isoform X1 n=1 Tax=Solanum pennellii TaxID=28526 RepID=A0ABM1G429_SOLPN|nr:homeobox-DDT domain protein RLT1 isoform X1 [Solanum pennellii]
MDGGSDGEGNRNLIQSSSEGPKKPKRQMKTPFQLETLERVYAMETYPSEAIRAELSEKLGLTDRQLQMWFCHRRLKDKNTSGGTEKKPRAGGTGGKRNLPESPREDLVVAEAASDRGSGSVSRSGSGSGSSRFDNGDDMPAPSIRSYESPRRAMERRVIACIEAQLGEPLRDDGPIIGVEFDELPPGAFGIPIDLEERTDHYRQSFDSKLYGPYDAKVNVGSALSLSPVLTNGHREPAEPKIVSDKYGQIAAPYPYESSVDCPSKNMATMQRNGHFVRESGVEGQSIGMMSQQSRQRRFLSPLRDNEFVPGNEDILQLDRKRKSEEFGMGREVQVNEKRMRKELEKQDLLRRKMEEQMKKDMEKQDRERKKEEQRLMREQQRKEERFQREEKREMERREKFLQRELVRVERKKQKDELRKEKEAAKQKAAMEKAMARRIAKESMELIEDERLELMDLAASSKGLPSIASLNYDTLQNLESFRESLCEFPPKSVQLKKPFSIEPWIASDDNVGNLLMAWRFCLNFADVLGLWPFTLDEFLQAFHDYDSILLAEIQIALLKLIIKDIEDVARTPSGGPGTNQYSAVNPEGGHPQIVEGAYLWGFDIRNWQRLLNPLTWSEVLRQFALSAGFGPPLKKKRERTCLNDSDETKGCEDIVSNLRSGSAALNAVAIMQEKGFMSQRKSRHRLTPGTVKFAAYHVLALEGDKGLNVLDIAERIQKSGLRDLSTSKTPEASISVALSRDPILFERIAPSTYNVRLAFRKDPADADAIISAAKEKIQRYANGFLSGQNAEDEERDDDSEGEGDVAEGPEVDDLGTSYGPNKNNEQSSLLDTCLVNGKSKLSDEIGQQIGVDVVGVAGSNPSQGCSEIDETKAGEPWVQGLAEGEYSDLCVEERLSALIALIGIANEGNSIRAILEDRLDAANALKKQMWAESQLDKRRLKEETINKFNDSSFNVVVEGSQSPLGYPNNKNHGTSPTTLVKDDSAGIVDNLQNHFESIPAEKNSAAQETFVGQFAVPSGNTAERSRMQLKSFIGHKAEEMYVYRSLPLGQDRRRNRYWLFVASGSSEDPGSGRIFVESPHGCWKLIDTEEAFDCLLASLDTRGVRESHLHIMLQKIEGPFKGRARQNMSCGASSNPTSGASADSPGSAIYGVSSDSWETSSSFKIELGRTEEEKKNALQRYQVFQIWMWKECLSSSILCAMQYGKKRCLPLLGICGHCLDSYLSEEGICPSCNKMNCEVDMNGKFIEQAMDSMDNLKIDYDNLVVSNACPVRVRLMKAVLSFTEVCVPYEALQSSWTEDCRKTWGLKLQNSSSPEDLLQILTQLEGVINRDYLSADYETAQELMGLCALSRKAALESTYPEPVPQLPWIPQTTSAVALRLLELDSSISYDPQQKTEAELKNKVDCLPKPSLGYASLKDPQKIEPTVIDHGLMREENWDYLSNMPSSSRSRQVVRGRGGSRPRGKLQKGTTSKQPESDRTVVRPSETLTQVLIKQGETHGQRHVRGRRTVRKRRIEQKIVEEAQPDYLGDRSSRLSLVVSPRKHVTEEFDMNMEGIEATNDNSISMEAAESDDSAPENTYDFNRSDLMDMSDEDQVVSAGDGIEDDNDDEDDDDDNADRYRSHGQNLGRYVNMDDDDSDRDGDANEDQESGSSESEDYSD